MWWIHLTDKIKRWSWYKSVYVRRHISENFGEDVYLSPMSWHVVRSSWISSLLNWYDDLPWFLSPLDSLLNSLEYLGSIVRYTRKLEYIKDARQRDLKRQQEPFLPCLRTTWAWCPDIAGVGVTCKVYIDSLGHGGFLCMQGWKDVCPTQDENVDWRGGQKPACLQSWNNAFIRM